jgi:hypothetical protein
MAREVSLPALRAGGNLRVASAAAVAVQGVWPAGLGDGRDGPASDAGAADGLVLGHLPGDYPYPRPVGGAVASVRQRRLAQYIELLRWPLTHNNGLGAWRQSALIALSQFATAAAAGRELFSGLRELATNDPDVQREPT